MTPHDEFTDLSGIMRQVGNPEALIVDIWGFWKEMRHRSRNGYFSYEEAIRSSYKEAIVR
jgi:hypothetical protein